MKIGSLGWLSISFLFLHFLYTFLNKKRDFFFYYSLTVSLLSMIINLSTNLITNGYINTFWGPGEQHSSLFLPAIILTIILPAVYAVYLMTAEVRTTKDFNVKKAVKLMLVGSIITVTVGLISNVVLPSILKINSIVKIGESGTVFQSIFIFIAIIKYKLFTISGIEEVAEDVYSNIRDAVAILNVEGYIIQVNNAFETLFGKKINTKSRVHINSLLPNHNFIKVFHDSQRGLEINGKWKYLSLTQSSVNRQNVEKGKVLIIRDETKRKEAELEIIKAKDAAEELNRLKSVFLTNMSHELRTPLISIIGFSELLTDEIKDDEQRVMAESITTSGKRLVDTLNSILELSRIESNEIALNLKFININKLIGELVLPYKTAAEKKGLAFEASSAREDIEIAADKNLFEAAFNHIMGNAVKYTEEGNIRVEVDIEPSPERNWTVIKVSDTGVGISKEKLPVIFDPFRQASEGMSRKFEGAGLGLTIVKRFIELMKGSITADSEPGKGSTFIIKLPYVQREKRAGVEVQNNMEEKVSGKDIDKALPEVLLIDDDSMSIFITRDSLRDFCQVEVCILPETAVILASRTIFSAVIINCDSNEAGKFEMLKKLKDIKGYNNVSFVAIISGDVKSKKKLYFQKGFAQIIGAPLSADKLSDTLQAALNSKK